MRIAKEAPEKSALAASIITPAALRAEPTAAGRMEATSKAGGCWPHTVVAAITKRLAAESIRTIIELYRAAAYK